MPGAGGSSGPSASPTYDRLKPDASMDVLGSLQAHSNAATQYQNDATGGMGNGSMFDFQQMFRRGSGMGRSLASD